MNYNKLMPIVLQIHGFRYLWENVPKLIVA